MRAAIRTATAADGHRAERGVHVLVADEGGVVRGYASFDVLGNVGHVRSIAVVPAARRRGIGTQLLAATAAALRAAGATEWNANVDARDPAAMRLCEKLGMRAERSAVVALPWAAIARLPAELATVLDVADEVDDDIERAFALPAGRVAMARRQGRVLAQLRDRALAVVGFAALAVAHASASPFRVARPALAAPLLAALRGHARGDRVQLVVDNDPALEAVLCEAGGAVHRQLVHYSGELTPAALRCA